MAKKDLGVVPAVYPMPVLIVAAYDKGGKVNTMNAAWGMICDMDKIALFISESHKTTKNILETKAFTVAIVSCNDGLRPVIMKLEATDEESKIDYVPVEK